MKVLNVYLTQIYCYMESKGFFQKNEDSMKQFIHFAQDLGYPEFGIQEGLSMGDFSCLPNSDLIGFNDLDSNVLMNLPTDVVNYIKKEIPEFYHQIEITLALKAYSSSNVSLLVNRLIDYLIFLRKGYVHNPIQRDFDFLNYVIDFISKPSCFMNLLNKISEDEEKQLYLWQNLFYELVCLSSDLDKVKRFASQIMISTTQYQYIDLLEAEILSKQWKGFVSDKIIKSIKKDSPSFIEIGVSTTFFSVRNDDRENSLIYDSLVLLMPKIRAIFPEIDVAVFSNSSFFQRKVLTISYNNLNDIKKKAFSTMFSTLLNPMNKNISADKFNNLVLTSLESVILLDESLSKSFISESECADLFKI